MLYHFYFYFYFKPSSVHGNGPIASTQLDRDSANLEIPIIIETTPEGERLEAKVALGYQDDEYRPSVGTKHMNHQLHNHGNFKQVTGNAVDHAASGTATPAGQVHSCSCTCTAMVERQLQELSQRLQRIENKIEGDMEAIFDVLKTCNEALKVKRNDTRNTIV